MSKNNQTPLEQLAARINTATKSPKEAFSDGRWNVGSFFITITDGGFDLQRVANASGGTTSALGTGHIPARRLSMLMNAFLLGLTFKADEKRREEAMSPEDKIERWLREYAAQRELEYVSYRKIGETEIELKTVESPQHHLGYLSNGGYAVLEPRFEAYLQADTPFVEGDILPYGEARRLAHELNLVYNLRLDDMQKVKDALNKKKKS